MAPMQELQILDVANILHLWVSPKGMVGLEAAEEQTPSGHNSIPLEDLLLSPSVSLFYPTAMQCSAQQKANIGSKAKLGSCTHFPLLPRLPAGRNEQSHGAVETRPQA